MGLGKTVTLLGLLLSHKKQGPRIPRPDGEYFYLICTTSNTFSSLLKSYMYIKCPGFVSFL